MDQTSSMPLEVLTLYLAGVHPEGYDICVTLAAYRDAFGRGPPLNAAQFRCYRCLPV